MKRVAYELIIECDESVLDSEVYDVLRDMLNKAKVPRNQNVPDSFAFEWALASIPVPVKEY